MNIKQSLLSIIILSIFITGCSSNQTNNSNQTKNEAIYQKTMTKVQNDVNEIMDKDYEYVINNMGEPYCTTYYINSNEISSIDILNQNLQSENMRLIYPKKIDKIQIEESAICIEIRDNKVYDVETYELSDLITEQNNKVDIVLNKYNNNKKIYLTDEINNKLNQYIGQDKSSIKNIVGETSPNYKIYDNRNKTQTNIYLLKETNDEVKLLGICVYDNKIKDIKVVNKDDVKFIKSYLCK